MLVLVAFAGGITVTVTNVAWPAAMIGGLAKPTATRLVATTVMVPSTESLLVQIIAAFGSAGKTTALNAPLIGLLKSANESPATKLVEPTFVTIKALPE